MTVSFVTTDDLEKNLGGQFKALRLAEDIDQETLARTANVSLSALRSLEAGRGSSLKTLIRVARALGRLDWINDFYPELVASPMALARAQAGIRAPQRVSPRRKVGS